MIRVVNVEAIKVHGDRHRKDMGDLEGLRQSIEKLGLLHPIVVHPDLTLLCGERRLRAVTDLGWSSVAVRVVDCDELLAEHDENEVRKDFTPTEKLAIAKEIKQRIESGAVAKEPGRTRDQVAEAAGFGSETEMRRTQEVVDSGDEELIEAMDKGEETPATAAKKAKSKQRKKYVPKEVQRDGEGREIPEHLADHFADEAMVSLAADAARISSSLRSIARWNKWVSSEFLEHLEGLGPAISMQRPFAVCPYCEDGKGCAQCRHTGFIPKWRIEEIRESLK